MKERQKSERLPPKTPKPVKLEEGMMKKREGGIKNEQEDDYLYKKGLKFVELK